MLEKPVVRDLVSSLGRSTLEADDLITAWPNEIDAYRLTLDGWPSPDVKPRREWHQVTRTGYSLVLQLNLPVAHSRALEKSIGNWKPYTSSSYHPVSSEELTLGWSRIDLDLSSGEALIEEIQSDWVRDVKYYAESNYIENRKAWDTYYKNYLAPKVKRWSQTMMTATLWFLLEELGIKTIFFHTFETGNRLKKISSYLPPRSIYTDMPRKLCFRTTYNGPSFLRDSK